MSGFQGRIENRSTGDETATFMSRREMNQVDIHSMHNVCNPSKGAFRERIVLLFVDAGSVTIDATCSKIIAVSSREYAESTSRKVKNPPGVFVFKTSSFDFDAESGHIYTFSQKNEECMSLLDITSEETVVACEPYQEID